MIKLGKDASSKLLDFYPEKRKENNTMPFEDKAPNIQEMIKNYAPNERAFSYSNQCAWCGKKGIEESSFRNASSVKEFKISRLCQTCQDEVFGED